MKQYYTMALACMFVCAMHVHVRSMEKKALAFKKDQLFVSLQEKFKVSDEAIGAFYTTMHAQAQHKINQHSKTCTQKLMSDVEGRTAPYFFETELLQTINLELLDTKHSVNAFKNKITTYMMITILRSNKDSKKILERGPKKAYYLLPGLSNSMCADIQDLVTNYDGSPPLKDCLK